jgi:hypothetical protein
MDKAARGLVKTCQATLVTQVSRRTAATGVQGATREWHCKKGPWKALQSSPSPEMKMFSKLLLLLLLGGREINKKGRERKKGEKKKRFPVRQMQ